MWWRLFIKCLLCTYIYVGLDYIHAFSLWILWTILQSWIRHSICLMLWLEESLHPAMRLPTPTRTPTQLAVYCVLQIHLSDVWWWILLVKECPLDCIQRRWKIFNKLLCYYIGHYIIFRTRRIIWTFWIQICSDYNLNSMYIYYCYIWLVGFCYVIMYTILSVYCKFMCITCISTCALGILKTCLNWYTPDWKSHCLSCNIHNSALE